MNTRAPGFNPDDEPWDAWGDEPADPEPYITDEGECSNCGEQLNLEDGVSHLDFQVEASGVQPGTDNGPAVHWAIGTIECSNCHARLPYEAVE